MIATETIFVKPSILAGRQRGSVFMQVKAINGWAAVTLTPDQAAELVNALDLASTHPSRMLDGYTINER